MFVGCEKVGLRRSIRALAAAHPRPLYVPHGVAASVEAGAALFAELSPPPSHPPTARTAIDAAASVAIRRPFERITVRPYGGEMKLA